MTVIILTSAHITVIAIIITFYVFTIITSAAVILTVVIIKITYTNGSFT